MIQHKDMRERRKKKKGLGVRDQKSQEGWNDPRALDRNEQLLIKGDYTTHCHEASLKNMMSLCCNY